jgi:branched-subunit amino acid permease
MVELTGPRCLAMSVVGVVLGWLINLDSSSTMSHYRALSHDALLSELAKQNEGQLSTNIMGALFVVAALVIAVDLLTRVFEALWRRIEPPRPAGPGSTPDATVRS